jgi:hypothetical protein
MTIDYLDSFLTNGIPNTVAKILHTKGDCIKIQVNNKPMIVTSNPTVATHVFKTNPSNYIERFCDDDGLKLLGMYDQGVIWNNNHDAWHKASKLFTNSITARSLEDSRAFVTTTTKILFSASVLVDEPTEVSVLNLCRRVRTAHLLTYI